MFLAFVVAAIGVQVPVANAVPGQGGWTIALDKLAPSTAKSGEQTQFLLSVQCAALEAASCDNGVVRIPLPEHIESDVEVEAHPYITSKSVEDGVLTLNLPAAFPAGGSIQVELGFTAENYLTPNNYTPEFTATVSADNAPSASASDSATFTATASLVLRKKLPSNAPNGTLFKLETPIRYSIEVCDSRAYGTPGVLALESGTLVDTLPANAEFIAAPGGEYDETAGTVTWDLGSGTASPCDSYSVTVQYSSDDYANGNSVTNSVALTARPIGEAADITRSASVNHRFGTPAPTGAFCKSASSSIAADTDTLNACDSTAPVQTYAGQWAAPTADLVASAHITGGIGEASFRLSAQNTTTGTAGTDHLTDAIPCRTNNNGQTPRTYYSNAIGTYCADPVFIVTGIRTGSIFPANITRTAANDGSRPTYVNSSGQTREFVATNLGTAINGGWWFTPQPGDKVAEVSWNDVADPGGQSANVIRAHVMRIHGYVAGDLQAGDTVVNTGRAAVHVGDTVISDTQSARLRVIDDVVGYVNKTMNTTQRYTITAGMAAPSQAPVWHDGVTITDLLPIEIPRVELQSIRKYDPATGESGAMSASEYTLEQIADYGGTGRTLVRITVPNGVELRSAGTSVSASFDVPNQYPWNGGRTNEARLFLPGHTIDRCGDLGLRGSVGVGAADTDDWDGDGVTSGDNFCTSSASLTRTQTAPVISVEKMVKGNLDSEYAAYPKVGLTDPSLPGDASYRVTIRNAGGGALRNVVAYDVLPKVGDTGVSDALAARARGSEFRPLMTGAVTASVANPAQWEIAYSTAANPCRPEMPATTTPNWPAGCTDDWTTTFPSGDPGSVTALRFKQLGSATLTSDATAANKAQFTWPMSTPSSAQVGQVAWNSVAVSAANNSGGAKLLTSEPPKVGLAVPQTDIELTKTVDKSSAAVGEVVTFTVTAKHGTSVRTESDGSITYVDAAGDPTGAVAPATGVKVTDVLPAGLELVPGSAVAQQGGFDAGDGVWTVGTVQVGGAVTLTYKAKVTAAGAHLNVAHASALGVEDVDSAPGDCDLDAAEDDCAAASVSTLAQGLTLSKLVESEQGSGTYVDANEGSTEFGVHPSGAAIKYRFVVANTGGSELRDVKISDPRIPYFCDAQFAVGSIAAGDSRTVDCTLPIGFGVGTTVNTASVSAKTLGGATLTASDTAQVLVPTPGITVEKTTNGEDAEDAADAVQLGLGDAVTWTYVVTNTGTDTLTEVTLADDQEAAVSLNPIDCLRSTGPWDDPLEPGDSITCVFTGEADWGLYSNTATARGKGTVTPITVTGTDVSHYLVPIPDASIAVLKSTNGISGTVPGDRPTIVEGRDVTWTYVIVNDGDDDLTDISLSDDEESNVELDEDACVRSSGAWGAPLAPAATITCTFTGTAGATDYENTASVTAEGSVSGDEVDDTDVSGYRGEALAPAVRIDKRTNGVDAATAATAVQLVRGAKVSWSYVITNTGNEALEDISLADDKESAVELDEDACVRSSGTWGTPLAPGATITCGFSGTATEAKYENVGTVTATGVGTDEAVDDDDVSHYASSKPSKADPLDGGSGDESDDDSATGGSPDGDGPDGGTGGTGGTLARTGSNIVALLLLGGFLVVTGGSMRAAGRRPGGPATTTL